MTKELPLIADYVPVLQSMVENYHNAGFKSQKITMELITNIGHYMNIARENDLSELEGLIDTLEKEEL